MLSDVVDPLNYFVSSRWYVERAKQLLSKKEAPSLFYAAFELRAAVEARQLEYAEAIEHLDSTKIRHWKLSETYKKLRSNSFVGAIVHMQFKQNERSLDLYHVPISEGLKKETEKLGDLLHAQSKYRGPADHFWDDLRKRLIRLYRAVWIVCRGNCLVPPLMGPDGELHPIKMEWPVVDTNPLKGMTFEKGSRLEVRIEYLKEAPVEWECDL